MLEGHRFAEPGRLSSDGTVRQTARPATWHSGSMEVVTDCDGGVLVRIHAQPGANRSQVVGLHGDAIKVKLAAPPADGRANAELCRFLAVELGVRPAAVAMVSGESNRSKRVRVTGVSRADVLAILER